MMISIYPAISYKWTQNRKDIHNFLYSDQPFLSYRFLFPDAYTRTWKLPTSILCFTPFKGSVSRDFLLLVFLWFSFPPAPDYPIRTVSNFWKFAEIFASQGINGINNTGGKFCHQFRFRWYRWQICHRCQWHLCCILSCEYLREFWKKIETALIVYSGAWGKLIHEKNQKSKISWNCPLTLCHFHPQLLVVAVATYFPKVHS